jgi:hypothetical protein
VTGGGLTAREIQELGYERTPKGWAPLEVAEEHRQTGLTRAQWQRFSFVTARGWAALPESGLKTFALAACLGKMMTKEGTFDRLRNVGDALCVVVRPGIRDRVISLQGAPDPDLRKWRRHVVGWVGVGMAHRCDSQPRYSVTLFFEPQETCPVCAQADISVPARRTSEYRLPDISVPVNVPIPGVALRDGEGDAGSEPWILKKKEMLEQLKNLDGYKEELAAKEAKEDE